MTDQLNKSETGDIRINNNRVLRWLLLTGGFVFTAIGVLGMFLPLLPTTVFLILAAWCFARSSEKFYNWLHANRFFGKFLSNYRQGKGMTVRSKFVSLSVLFIGIGYSIIFATELLYVRILLIAIAAGVSWHILSIKTYKP